MWLALLLFATAVDASLIVEPINTVGDVGSTVVLQASVNASRPVQWIAFWLNGTTCTVYTGSAIGSCADSGRYSIVTDSAGEQFDLKITNLQVSDAGTYFCLDFATDESAVAVLGVVAESPAVSTTADTLCALDGGLTTLVCQMTYYGDPLIPLVLNWNMTGGTATTQNGRVFSSTMSVTARSSSVSYLLCNVTYLEPTGSTVPPLSTVPSNAPATQNATNAPSYVLTATNSSITAIECPGRVLTTYDAAPFTGGITKEGSNIICSVEGENSYVSGLFNWTDNTNGAIMSTSSTVKIESGDYDLQCWAIATINCGTTHQTCPDTLSQQIVAKATNEKQYSEATVIGLSVALGVAGLYGIAVTIFVIFKLMTGRGKSSPAPKPASDISGEARSTSASQTTAAAKKD